MGGQNSDAVDIHSISFERSNKYFLKKIGIISSLHIVNMKFRFWESSVYIGTATQARAPEMHIKMEREN